MRTDYECLQCREKDSDSGNGGTAPLALICWNCKAGAKMGPADQVKARRGMLQVVKAA